ncbi:GNAT acetyltransferase-like protein [Mobilisporobacter senegalensis]|uniref:GNAT acetyltransferase-like protein n=1 Tax=Mobilisporobacter senegalensis TaxID=1329262 RepID=A0A3N1XLZ0_9FIRM|nr:GNAT family N-acetyltransferase [Mobilisporobacter senegalensis]ROR27151.1 GNAT acetyltransferase-like protein [Mobilisporobacter senegalensis]
MIKVDKLANCNIKKITYGNNPSFLGIVSGECKGDLWVDDIKNPSLALVYSYAVGGYAILGNPQEEAICNNFYHFLIHDLFPELRKKDEDYFEFSAESIQMEKIMLNVFSDKRIKNEDEYFFIKNTRVEAYIHTSNEYKIIKVNENFIQLLELGAYENKDLLDKRLLESWGSYHNFLNKSIAFAALYQNKIVAIIIGTARFNNIIPIDIETEENHRKKGLATALAQYFVNECINNHLVPQWNCVESNIPSKKTAQKAGFTLLKKKPYYWFEI